MSTPRTVHTQRQIRTHERAEGELPSKADLAVLHAGDGDLAAIERLKATGEKIAGDEALPLAEQQRGAALALACASLLDAVAVFIADGVKKSAA